MSNIKINNTDIANYGFIPTKYLENLFALPKAEEVPFIEWYEGGFDYDLQDGIKLQDSREIEIELASVQYSNRFITFIGMLMANTYNNYLFSDINETLTLRFVEQSNNNLFGATNGSKFKIKLLEENYSRILTDTHIDLGTIDTLLEIDNVNVNSYGMVLTNGYDDLLRYARTHERERNKVSQIKPRAKDIKLEFACTSIKTEDFIQNYYSFFAMLIRANIRDLKLNYRGYLFQNKAFYQGMGVNELIIQDGLVWCKFFVNLKAWLV